MSLFDVSAELVAKAIEDVGQQLKMLEHSGLLRGSLSMEQQLALVSGATTVKECLEGACYVQECVPENLELKKEIFKMIDEIVGEDAILASSTSCILPSLFTEELKHRGQTIVAHPVTITKYVFT